MAHKIDTTRVEPTPTLTRARSKTTDDLQTRTHSVSKTLVSKELHAAPLSSFSGRTSPRTVTAPLDYLDYQEELATEAIDRFFEMALTGALRLPENIDDRFALAELISLIAQTFTGRLLLQGILDHLKTEEPLYLTTDATKGNYYSYTPASKHHVVNINFDFDMLRRVAGTEDEYYTSDLATSLFHELTHCYHTLTSPSLKKALKHTDCISEKLKDGEEKRTITGKIQLPNGVTLYDPINEETFRRERHLAFRDTHETVSSAYSKQFMTCSYEEYLAEREKGLVTEGMPEKTQFLFILAAAQNEDPRILHSLVTDLKFDINATWNDQTPLSYLFQQSTTIRNDDYETLLALGAEIGTVAPEDLAKQSRPYTRHLLKGLLVEKAKEAREQYRQFNQLRKEGNTDPALIAGALDAKEAAHHYGVLAAALGE